MSESNSPADGIRTGALLGFDAVDSEITFKSSDGRLFKLHKKHLEVGAGGFPPSEFSQEPDEVVPLPESSETLEVLFQYLYPARHPLLLKLEDAISFGVLASVAEAAEKYQVYMAMDVYMKAMGAKLHDHPCEILIYAEKHGYTTLLDQAAILLLDAPFKETMGKLPIHLSIPWAMYHAAWTQFQIAICHNRFRQQTYQNQNDNQILMELTSKVSLVAAGRVNFSKIWWDTGMKQRADAIGTFSHFI
ncbi:hypothetical protein DXG03_008349 [Asterophora parasitica]|uniref:BTB domain-containing protein n=1 Tax=Asterophora parasitica TaxID=117018 RepID=A0A9P7G7Z1_9AGAR|nr:hypothetical protein DXG03_008349 [Asterophora parasitica]